MECEMMYDCDCHKKLTCPLRYCKQVISGGGQ